MHPDVFVFQLNGERGTKGMSQLNDLLGKRREWRDLSVALVDMTGVANIDAGVVQHLADIISTLRLPCMQVLLARGDSSVDRKLANLGVNISDITMCHSLAAGLWMVLDIVES